MQPRSYGGIAVERFLFWVNAHSGKRHRLQGRDDTCSAQGLRVQGQCGYTMGGSKKGRSRSN